MSSHHIVRDKQEPGVLILNWENETATLLEQLCQWSPIIIVDETCVASFLALGLKLNVVITADKALIGALEYQAPLDFIESHHDAIEIVERDVMAELHVLGSLPWEKKSNETHVFYKKGKRYSKVGAGLSVWLSDEEKVAVYSNKGKLIDAINGNNGLVDFGEFTGLWLERRC